MPGSSVYPSACKRFAALAEHKPLVRTNLCESDRRGSNPRPPEPQSAGTCFHVLPTVSESAYVSLFFAWDRPAFQRVSRSVVSEGVSIGFGSSGALNWVL